jgi:hypothetical protein
MTSSNTFIHNHERATGITDRRTPDLDAASDVRLVLPLPGLSCRASGMSWNGDLAPPLLAIQAASANEVTLTEIGGPPLLGTCAARYSCCACMTVQHAWDAVTVLLRKDSIQLYCFRC